MSESRVVPRVVVVDHHDSYTWNLVHLVAGVTGALPEVVEHDEVAAADLGGFTHIVLSPGPGHPADPADFALGRAVFELDRPVLGVCLGMQALVVAFGGTVEQDVPAHGEVAVVSPRRHGRLRRRAVAVPRRCATTRSPRCPCPTPWSRPPGATARPAGS